MAVAHVVAGAINVKFRGTSLGYTRDGVQIRVEPRFIDVFSDDFGGASGAPADVQYVGSIALINCELTKYEHSAVEILTSHQSGGTAGIGPAFGTLLRAGSLTGVLYLDGENVLTPEERNFPVSFLRGAYEVNKGTRYSTAFLSFEAHIDAVATRKLYALAAPS